MNTVVKGKIGETTAVKHLENKNYKILSRNFRCKYGEIDIIAINLNTLVFFEVKSWKTYNIQDLEYSINNRKQKRIIDSATHYISCNEDLENYLVRFDVLFIDSQTKKIEHLMNAYGDDNKWLE